ncbi:unnamed protein product (macronuclear) [Paramecium tetraurelia]|uniref:Transmembrane protein n=1 Tax=Paramecium tetraurelia TaxID=5888 RepID=A0CJA6_PARTE|nr:uncharacterized protein GSPATT00000584001 [Paramecium tetraurelia]CAK70873.1 unnamed protein product [Paramecium tetraurelia]|eukprot:XP_001438270.1 hypothetical protein (macronuclear) [Paramecium tetraurelia strain d4-2]
MFKSSTSLSLKSDTIIAERSIYTMQTIRTRESSIQLRKLENNEKQQQAREYQNSSCYYDKKELDFNKNMQQLNNKTYKNGIIGTESTQKKKEARLITKTMYSNQQEQKQKEFIKLITIGLCLVMISVIIFHKKEPQQIKSLF